VRRRPAAAFFLLTFAISWAAWSAVFLVPMPRPGRLVLNQAGLAGPLLAALIVIGTMHGRRGVGRFLGRLLQWRVGAQWVLFALFGAAVLGLTAIGLYVLGGNNAPAVAFTLAPGALLSGLREEYGWRGFALPRLQERFGALKASVFIGALWTLWHLPIVPFVRMGLPGLGRFAVFSLEVVALSILMTWVYNHTAGSLLPPVLYHAAYNLTLSGLGIPAIVPLWLTYLALTWVVVAVVVWRCGAARLSRRPLPPASRPHVY
jgi:membrane protease YdiL (CAAX protease family)